MATEPGLCQCGCGRQTNLAPQTSTRDGWIKGEPQPFVKGHSRRVGPGSYNWKWRGGKKAGKGGYILTLVPNHPTANDQGYVPEHRLVIEGRIGRCLDRCEQVHHVNEDKADNRADNLWVFANNASHSAWHKMLLGGELRTTMEPVRV